MISNHLTTIESFWHCPKIEKKPLILGDIQGGVTEQDMQFVKYIT